MPVSPSYSQPLPGALKGKLEKEQMLDAKDRTVAQGNSSSQWSALSWPLTGVMGSEFKEQLVYLALCLGKPSSLSVFTSSRPCLQPQGSQSLSILTPWPLPPTRCQPFILLILFVSDDYCPLHQLLSSAGSSASLHTQTSDSHRDEGARETTVLEGARCQPGRLSTETLFLATAASPCHSASLHVLRRLL